MFYKLIERKRDAWYASADCTVKSFVEYIKERGQMRDAQTEAIKTYLFLKIACGNRPLWQLFSEGTFNSLDTESLELSGPTRDTFRSTPGAVALFEYARLRDRHGRQLAPELEKYIRHHAAEIDYGQAFRTLFRGASYTDYLFSLPMGAGKTFLMAAFIYIDLYFALVDPDNPAFAHNFMIFAPSGLKSSIIPSLKHIMAFDPTWIIPEPYASEVRRLIKFEILDEQKSTSKSTLVRNPNAQKLGSHQPFDSLIGLVAITNAEKVILDRIDRSMDTKLFSEDELTRIAQANELRDTIGRLPHLSIFIDEVHHASDGEIKLRQVVERWTRENSFCSVLGFSGTPYLSKPETTSIGPELSIKSTDIPNVAYYYPLTSGLNNFLKTPTIKYADTDTATIVSNGVRDFLDNYKDKVYSNGTCAKLAIYCGQIETLEEEIYPLVTDIATQYGLDAATAILKYHGGNKTYPQPDGADLAFAELDTDLSPVRIILLVQIGKEGWDCKSLTGVILPQKGVCPTNMILQTSCRCLRQVTKDEKETAIIWLNQTNAETLGKQLRQQQDITLQEFGTIHHPDAVYINRYSRTDPLQLPPIEFCSLHIDHTSIVVDETGDIAGHLSDDALLTMRDMRLVHEGSLNGEPSTAYTLLSTLPEEQADYISWLFLIAKESLGTLPISRLRIYDAQLRDIFRRITKTQDGILHFAPEYDQRQIRSNIRLAFGPRHRQKSEEHTVGRKEFLLINDRLKPVVRTFDTSLFYPSQKIVDEILLEDKSPRRIVLSKEQREMIESLKQRGIPVNIGNENKHPERWHTYHYLPYRFESLRTLRYFSNTLLRMDALRKKRLEVYYTGEEGLSKFAIDCYSRHNSQLAFAGLYRPDFIIMSRTTDKKIHRVLLIETEGKGTVEKRDFVKNDFIPRDARQAGYQRYALLVLPQTLSDREMHQLTEHAVDQFFS